MTACCCKNTEFSFALPFSGRECFFFAFCYAKLKRAVAVSPIYGKAWLSSEPRGSTAERHWERPSPCVIKPGSSLQRGCASSQNESGTRSQRHSGAWASQTTPEPHGTRERLRLHTGESLTWEHIFTISTNISQGKK